MKKSLLAATILGATFISTAAQAQSTAQEDWPYWYVGLTAGAIYQSDSDYTSNGTAGTTGYDTGTKYGFSAGYIIPQDATFGANPGSGRNRLELEVALSDQGFDSGTGKVKSKVATANYYRDFNIGSNVMPYVGAGVGVAQFNVTPTNSAGADGKDTVPVYQIGAGLSYAPENIPRTELILGYKYLGTMTDPNVDNTGAGRTDLEVDNHTLEVGARFRF